MHFIKKWNLIQTICIHPLITMREIEEKNERKKKLFDRKISVI